MITTENVKAVLATSDPNRRWKSRGIIDGKVVVFTNAVVMVITEGQYRELGMEIADCTPKMSMELAGWLEFDRLHGARVAPAGNSIQTEKQCGAGIMAFEMGWRFAVSHDLAVLLDVDHSTASRLGEGFFVVSRGSDGEVVAGVMSLGNVSQAEMETTE